MHSFDYFDEIWCPSDFVRESIALKSPFPVLTMGHAIGFERPAGDKAALRARLGLPAEPFLFLSLFDLNSYSTRKNPGAVIEAFRRSGLAGTRAGRCPPARPDGGVYRTTRSRSRPKTNPIAAVMR